MQQNAQLAPTIHSVVRRATLLFGADRTRRLDPQLGFFPKSSVPDSKRHCANRFVNATQVFDGTINAPASVDQTGSGQVVNRIRKKANQERRKAGEGRIEQFLVSGLPHRSLFEGRRIPLIDQKEA
jgi:hypothetical protein